MRRLASAGDLVMVTSRWKSVCLRALGFSLLHACVFQVLPGFLGPLFSFVCFVKNQSFPHSKTQATSLFSWSDWFHFHDHLSMKVFSGEPRRDIFRGGEDASEATSRTFQKAPCRKGGDSARDRKEGSGAVHAGHRAAAREPLQKPRALSGARRLVVFSLSQPCFNCRFIFRQTGCFHLRLSASQLFERKEVVRPHPRGQAWGLGLRGFPEKCEAAGAAAAGGTRKGQEGPGQWG